MYNSPRSKIQSTQARKRSRVRQAEAIWGGIVTALWALILCAVAGAILSQLSRGGY